MYVLRVDGSEIRPSPPGMYETFMNTGISTTSTGARFLPSTLIIEV